MILIDTLCRLMTIANYAMKLEREVWGVLEGPWGSDTWMSWRRDWAQRVTLLDLCEEQEGVLAICK